LKKIILILAALAVLSLVLTACPSPKEVYLKYDDGEVDGRIGIGGPGSGALVEFLPPSLPYTIKKIKMSGELVGSEYEDRMVEVLIWGKDQKELWSGSLPHTEFEISGWTELNVPNVVANDNFSVVVVTNTPRDSGVYLHYDSSVKNEHSGVVQGWKVEDWHLGVPREKVNWMIRVVGTIEK